MFQACKVKSIGKVDFEDEIEKRFEKVYVPNWFSVDIKIGVSVTRELGVFAPWSVYNILTVPMFSPTDVDDPLRRE